LTIDEFEILLNGGGEWLVENQPNGDGTFFNTLKFGGRVFCTSTNQMIERAGTV
jgi:hypothetical protein